MRETSSSRVVFAASSDAGIQARPRRAAKLRAASNWGTLLDAPLRSNFPIFLKLRVHFPDDAARHDAVGIVRDADICQGADWVARIKVPEFGGDFADQIPEAIAAMGVFDIVYSALAIARSKVHTVF